LMIWVMIGEWVLGPYCFFSADYRDLIQGDSSSWCQIASRKPRVPHACLHGNRARLTSSHLLLESKFFNLVTFHPGIRFKSIYFKLSSLKCSEVTTFDPASRHCSSLIPPSLYHFRDPIISMPYHPTAFPMRGTTSFELRNFLFSC